MGQRSSSNKSEAAVLLPPYKIKNTENKPKKSWLKDVSSAKIEQEINKETF